MARPTKYKKEYCQKIIDAMANGLSKESASAKIGISSPTFYDWINPDSPRFKPEFSSAIKEGTMKNQLFWEELGLDGAKGNIDKFNAVTWIFNMKNRFKWTDRQDMTSDSEKIQGIIIHKPDKLPEEDE